MLLGPDGPQQSQRQSWLGDAHPIPATFATVGVTELSTVRTYIEVLGGHIHKVAQFDEVITQNRTLIFYCVRVGQGWEVILEPEVSTWILGLPDDTYDRVEAAIDMLAQGGPGWAGHWSTRSPAADTRT